MGVEALGKDAFLNLLTAQLKFQDPLKPMDSTAFVAQLAQFRELETAIETNKKLDQLVSGNKAMSNLGAATLLGHKVEVSGGTLSHEAGVTEKIAYQLDENSGSEVIIQVMKGNEPIQTISVRGPLAQGNHEVLWDGKDKNGNQVPSGTYSYMGSLKVNEDELIPIKLTSEGEVTGVSYGDAGPTIMVNGVSVLFSEVKRIFK